MADFRSLLRSSTVLLMVLPFAFYATGLTHIVHSHPQDLVAPPFEQHESASTSACLSGCDVTGDLPAETPPGGLPAHNDPDCPICQFISHSAAIQVVACGDFVVDFTFQSTRPANSSQVVALVTALPVRIPRAPPTVL